MTLQLCYSALSPFCRKVRMALDFKGLPCTLIEVDRLEDLPVCNPRAEVPVLIDGDTVVCNSPDILAYLDRLAPQRPLYPADARTFAEVREWERLADTQLDAITSVIGTWQFGNLSPMPAGLLDAARRELAPLHARLQDRLARREFVCGEIGAADFAAYPHIASGAALGLGFDPDRHSDLKRWLKALRARPEGQADAAAVRAWWADRANKAVEADRINWGTFRLEWLLAHGHADWFADQVRQGKVLWSAGPANHALSSRSRRP